MRSCCTLNSGVDVGDVRINSIPSAWNVPNIKDKFLGQWSQRVPLFQPNKLPEVRGTLTHPIRNMARGAICDSGCVASDILFTNKLSRAGGLPGLKGPNQHNIKSIRI